jgi:type IV pilus assembly protein PilN
MRLTINLATRTYINTRIVTLSLAGVGAVLAIILLVAVSGLLTDAETVRKLTDDIAVLDGKQRAGEQPVNPGDYQALLDQVRFANGVIDRKTVNWLLLLDRFESVVPGGVALTSIQPDLKSRDVKVSGVALSFGKIRTLIEAMESSKDFSEVFLTSQAETRGADNQKLMTFTFACKVALK